jgi:hypothetical protein
MIPIEINEAAAIAGKVADLLLATLAGDQIGRVGSDLRRACGELKVFAGTFIVDNVIGQKLSNCFALARGSGATMDQFNRICIQLSETPTISLVATLINQACIYFGLQQLSNALVAMTFTSRQDVVAAGNRINPTFNQAEEMAADEMAQMVYQAVVSLHAAVTFHLYETARPLPQMLNFEFAAINPTLILSYRLYATADRADQLRAENKVVHPAFAPRRGQALAF